DATGTSRIVQAVGAEKSVRTEASDADVSENGRAKRLSGRAPYPSRSEPAASAWPAADRSEKLDFNPAPTRAGGCILQPVEAQKGNSVEIATFDQPTYPRIPPRNAYI